MPKKKFKCSRCDRSFSMAGHLGRHMSTIHASGRAKAAKKGGRGRRGKAKVGRPRGIASRLGLRTMTLDQLRQVMEAAREEGRQRIAELGQMFG